MSGGGGTTGATLTLTTRTTAATGNGTTTSTAGSSTTPTRPPPSLPHSTSSRRCTRTPWARRVRGWITTLGAGRTRLHRDRHLRSGFNIRRSATRTPSHLLRRDSIAGAMAPRPRRLR
eukprot:15504390-Heterocapsa_arctica.AAC.1